MRTNNPPLITQRLATIGVWGVAGIVVLLPFHAFLTTWLSTALHHYDLLRAWKEALLLIGLILGVSVVLTDKTRRWKQLLRATPMLWVLVFVCGTLLFTLATILGRKVTTEALLYGLMIQLRFLCLFGLAALYSCYNDLLYRAWQHLLLGPAVVVLLFGALQVTVLPHDFLTQFGYGPDTIPAYQTIDNKLEYQRVQATLRGANPYGAYLIVIIAALVVQLWNQRKNYLLWVFLGLAVFNLYFTYSRSAWFGVFVSVAVITFYLSSVKLRKLLLLLAAGVIVTGSAGVWAMQDNNYIQNTLFHSDETSVSEQSSNEQRGQALSRSFGEVIQQPFGGGIGSAGPASFRNLPDAPRIAENYFVQTGQEMGWLGIVGIIGVMVSVGLWLARRMIEPLGLVLFASFCGITLVNFVSHAWADDTISLLWWGLCGGLMGYAILNKEQTEINNGTKAKKRIKTAR